MMNDIEFIEKQEKLLHEIAQKYINNGFEALPADEPSKLKIGWVFYKYKGEVEKKIECEEDDYISIPLHDIPEDQIKYKCIEFDNFKEYYELYEIKNDAELLCRSDSPRQLKLGFTYLDREKKEIVSCYIHISKVKLCLESCSRENFDKYKKFASFEGYEQKFKDRLLGKAFFGKRGK